MTPARSRRWTRSATAGEDRFTRRPSSAREDAPVARELIAQATTALPAVRAPPFARIDAVPRTPSGAWALAQRLVVLLADIRNLGVGRADEIGGRELDRLLM